MIKYRTVRSMGLPNQSPRDRILFDIESIRAYLKVRDLKHALSKYSEVLDKVSCMYIMEEISVKVFYDMSSRLRDVSIEIDKIYAEVSGNGQRVEI